MTEWKTERISGWSELQEKLDPIAFQCVFRGQANAEWELISSFQRTLPNVDEKTALEVELGSILRFRSEAHLHLNQSVLPPDPFKLERMDSYVEWLMLMQHYGAPTRLLDWTNSPYVAAYFAMTGEWKHDAAIYYFDNYRVSQVYYQCHQRKPGEVFDFVTLPAATIQVTSGEPVLYTAVKKMRTGREIAQQGTFTLTSRVLTSHDKAIASTCRDHTFGRIIIPASLKKEFLMRLQLMNVTAAALFPGVEGICESIREQMRLRNEFVREQARAEALAASPQPKHS